jgi:hypothetical protein
MTKRKPKKKTYNEPPTLIAYWDKLTEGEIMQINNAVTYYFKRDNPGVLPFTSMASICMALMSYTRTLDNHRAVYYRLLHKLESHKHQAAQLGFTQASIVRIPASRLLKLVPARMRTFVTRSVFKFRLPFATNSWATAHVMDDVVQFECAPKHAMPLRAWLELT